MQSHQIVLFVIRMRHHIYHFEYVSGKKRIVRVESDDVFGNKIVRIADIVEVFRISRDEQLIQSVQGSPFPFVRNVFFAVKRFFA